MTTALPVKYLGMLYAYVVHIKHNITMNNQ
jgi:hypothetical protein